MRTTRTEICAMALALFFCFACGSTPRPADDSTTDWLAPGTRARGSSDAILGALGRKRGVGIREAFFERVTIPSWKNVEVYNAGAVTVTQNHIIRLKRLGLSAETLAAVNAKLGREKSVSFKMVILQIRDPQKLATEIDKFLVMDSGLRKVLSQTDMRIITSVGVVFDQEATSKLDAVAGAKATLTKVASQDVEFTVDVEVQKDYKIQIADGTIVAYQLARLCWAPDGTLVTLIRDIEKEGTCPVGSSEILNAGSLPTYPKVISVVPDLKRVHDSGPIKESSGYDYKCPVNYVLVGRKHYGDENKNTWYKCAPLISQPSTDLQVEVIDIQRWDCSDEAQCGFNAASIKDGRVLVGRGHSGDERGPTRYYHGRVVVAGKDARYLTKGQGPWIRESSGTWYEAPPEMMIIGREHRGDENGSTLHHFAKLEVRLLE